MIRIRVSGTAWLRFLICVRWVKRVNSCLKSSLYIERKRQGTFLLWTNPRDSFSLICRGSDRNIKKLLIFEKVVYPSPTISTLLLRNRWVSERNVGSTRTVWTNLKSGDSSEISLNNALLDFRWQREPSLNKWIQRVRFTRLWSI